MDQRACQGCKQLSKKLGRHPPFLGTSRLFAPMLPPLTSETFTPESLTWTFEVPASLSFFEGHFPGHPILPGVVALGWLLDGAEKFLGRPLDAVELLNVKFQVVILPGAQLELSVAPKGSGRLQAILRSEAGTHASALIPAQDG